MACEICWHVYIYNYTYHCKMKCTVYTMRIVNELAWIPNIQEPKPNILVNKIQRIIYFQNLGWLETVGPLSRFNSEAKMILIKITKHVYCILISKES